VDVHAVAEVEADRLQDREGGGGREHIHDPSTPMYFSMTGLAAASANASGWPLTAAHGLSGHFW